MNKSFADVFRRDTLQNTWQRLHVPRGQTSYIAIAVALGVLTGAPTAMTQTSGEAEREARLFEGRQADLGVQQVAQDLDGGFAISEISGPSNEAIPVRVRVPEIREGVYNFLVFRNLPQALEMSAGFPVEDRWVVPLDEVEDLTVTAPQDFRGAFELEVKLRVGGTDKSETRTVPVNITAPGGTGERTAQATTGDTREAQGLSEEKERAMIQRAETLLSTRDVSAARNIYRYLVQQGSGEAAFGMARTYDPAYVEEIGVAGMNAQDVDEAKKWYERAALLGHKEAQRRLKVMAGGTQ